jgi:gliding motility-associated-like protein
MRKATFFLICNLLIGSLLFGQTPPDFPAPPGIDCQSAPVLCSYEDLDGYNSVTPPLFNSIAPPGFCAIDVNNIQWLGFIAESTFLELLIEVENCMGSLDPPGGGLQAQIFGSSACCNDFFPQSNCYNEGTPNASFSLTASNLEVGDVYYLIIDGWSGDICDWSVKVTAFDNVPPPDPNELDLTIDGPTFVVQGGIETYSIKLGNNQNIPGQNTGCPYNFVGDCLSGIPCWVTDLEVSWDVPSQATVVGYPDAFSIEVIWNDFPGELCATLSADCIDTLSSCTTVYDATIYCQEARLLCGDELLLCQGMTADSSSQYPSSCDGGYNANWLKFYACGDSMNFSLALDTCSSGKPEQQLVMEVFELTYCDSTLFQQSLGCVSVGPGELDTFGLGGLEPQGLYLLMISNLLDDTSACSYQLQFLDGVAGQSGQIVNITDAYIDGPGEVCLGDTSSFTYVPPSFDIIGGNGGSTCSLPDTLCPQNSILSIMCWSIPEGATFLGDSCGVNTIQVIWSDTLDGEISVYWIQDTIALDTMTYDSANLLCCGSISGGINIGASIDIDIKFDFEYENYVICEGECIDLYGDTYCEATSFSVYDSCKIILVTVEVTEDQFIDLGEIILCEGDCFDLEGQFYCDPGDYSLTVQSPAGCETTYLFTIELIPQDIIELGTIILCEGECINIGGIDYCLPGIYNEIVIGQDGCDDLYNFIIEVVPPLFLSFGPVIELCDGAGDFYQITFDIFASDPQAFITVNGTPTSGVFISDPIPTGDPYEFVVDAVDSEGCGPISEFISGQFDCPLLCVADAGSLQSTTMDLCESQAAQVQNGGNEELGPDDMLEYILHTGTDPVNGTVISRSVQGIFSYSPGNMEYGQPYQVSVVAGLSNGSNQVDLSDPCLDFATGGTVTFHQDPLAFTFTNTNILTCNTPEALLEGIAEGGSGNLSAEWIGPAGSFNTTLATTLPGNYLFLVTDLLTGCVVEDQILLMEDKEAPEASIIASGSITCAQPEVLLDASSSSTGTEFQYQWGLNGNAISTGEDPFLTALVPGVYDLVVTDLNNGCHETAVINIEEDTSEPEFSITGESIIDCSTPAVQLFAISDDEILQYIWQTPPGAQINDTNISANTGGTYQLTATGVNGCTATQSYFIEDNSTLLIPQTNGGTIDCNQSAVQLSVGNQQPGWSYFWTGPGGFTSTETEPEVSLPGTYLLEVSDPEGCSGQDSTFVEADFDEPNASLFSSGELDCKTDEVQLFVSSSTPNVTVLWEGPDGFQSDLLNPWVTQAGTYLMTVTAPNGCTTSQDLEVLADFEAPQVEVSGVDLNCKNDPEQLIASSNTPGLSYLWTGPDGFMATGPYPEVSQTGIFNLIVTGQNGCTSTHQAEVGNLPPVRPLSLEAMTPSCFGDADGSLRVDGITGGSPPYDAVFNGFNYGSEREFNPLPAGNYPISLVDKDGCSWDSTLTVPEAEQFMIAFNSLPEIELGEEVEVELIANQETSMIEWLIDGEVILIDETTLELAPTSTVTVEVTATNERGCAVTEEIEVKVRKRNGIFVPNVFTPNNDGKNDYLTVYAGEGVDMIRSFQVFDRWGNLIFDRTNFSANLEFQGWDGRYNGKLVRPGVYIYRVVTLLADGSEKVYHGDVTIRR